MVMKAQKKLSKWCRGFAPSSNRGVMRPPKSCMPSTEKINMKRMRMRTTLTMLLKQPVMMLTTICMLFM